jgi:arsenate reductase-like glutaredoxin family protein
MEQQVPQITVYTSGPRCVDCNTIKSWLSQHGYRFTERNIREDPAALAELTQLGFQSVPVTLIGTTAIDGLELDAIQAALERRA